jgi:hypothetical protein
MLEAKVLVKLVDMHSRKWYLSTDVKSSNKYDDLPALGTPFSRILEHP